MAAELAGKEPLELFGERDLGHKTDRGAALFQGFADRADVEFAFAAAGHTINEDRDCPGFEGLSIFFV